MVDPRVASAPFTIEGWEEQPILDRDGIRIHSTLVRKQFTGDLQGTSTANLVMVHAAGEPAAYCGFEHVTGTLAGRSGSFVLQHTAGAGIGGGLELNVVPRSGTGELAGLVGTARIEIAGQVGDVEAAHRLILDYTIPGPEQPTAA